jgi:DNA-binding SARP family transcriptional activator
MNATALHLRLLGPLGVSRNGAAVALPRSRKVRALLAYLALGQGPVSRSRLCGLLWDVPNDPRGELRWCLSKLRGVLDDGDRRRVITGAPDLIALDLSDCHVDALEIEQALRAGAGTLSRDRLGEIVEWFGGELLEATEIDGNPELVGWLAATRHRYRAMHVTVLHELAMRARGTDDTFRHLDAWLQVAPFDQRAHEIMLDALVNSGRARDAEDHLAATIRSFEHEGLDWAPLRDAWRAGRTTVTSASRELAPPSAATHAAAPARQRARVAIMPFVDTTAGQTQRSVADGLTDDIITRLAKLRVLFVIARGTVYALRDRGIGAEEAGHMLDVDYIASGSVRRADDRLAIFVELAEARGGRIVWIDKLDAAAADTFTMLDAIVDRIVAAIAEEIEAAECKRAVLKPPSSLDAWESYHRGLWHMYKFTGPDNRHAEHLFRAAVELDPTFSRAYAGLSFSHFQNAFLELTPDHARQIELAFETAGQSLGADDRDPAAHWAMGRALWLRGVHDESVAELQRSIDLSPNFALGHYTLGFVNSQAGDPAPRSARRRRRGS